MSLLTSAATHFQTRLRIQCTRVIENAIVDLMRNRPEFGLYTSGPNSHSSGRVRVDI
jgi:hypothetical protein